MSVVLLVPCFTGDLIAVRFRNQVSAESWKEKNEVEAQGCVLTLSPAEALTILPGHLVTAADLAEEERSRGQHDV